MRFLLDQDIYATTARFLGGLGYDVVPVAQIGLSQADDEDLLKTAWEQDRVFAKALGAGVRYLRMSPSTQSSVHNELERVLKSYPEEELMKAFVVIEPGGHRFRRRPV